MNPYRAWLAAIRPKTLSLSAAPVVAGTALAWADLAAIHWVPFAAALLVAVLIQVATNLHNDVVDHERGSDKHDRLGPPRATAQGWLPAASVRRASTVCFVSSFLAGAYLVVVGGVPILVLGLLSLLAAAAYSGGPWPISYSPLGELFVFLFFGLAAVMGSYYLQVLDISWGALVTGSAMGLLAAAVLVVNNYRDMASDAASGRRTMAVLFGAGFSRLEYSLLVMMPFLLLPLSGGINHGLPWLPYLVLPWACFLIYRIYLVSGGELLNKLLAQTAQLQLAFAAALSIGLLTAGIATPG